MKTKNIWDKKSIFGSSMTNPILRKSRITKAFDLTSLGRPGICLRKSRAGNATGSGFPAETLRPRLQVNAMLDGLIKSKLLNQ
jgi:hypothetical protein